MIKEEVFGKMRQAIIEGKNRELMDLIKIAQENGISPLEIVNHGLVKGIEEVGNRFEREEAYLPELIMAANAMREAMAILEKEMKTQVERRKIIGKALAGTVYGDIHDIGKNIVCTLFVVNGFEVVDLGVNVPASTFVQKVKELKPDLLLLSALLTTTMSGQRAVIEELQRAGIRNQVLVMTGGAPVSHDWANQIGADGYGKNAVEAVNIAKKLLEKTT